MKSHKYSEYCSLLDNTTLPSYLSPEEQSELLKPLLNFVSKNTPSKLYKFRECNENNINAFRNQQIWFATAAKMNDDYDAILYCDKNKILTELNGLFDENGILIFLKTLKDNAPIPTKLCEIFGTQYVENAKTIVQNANDMAIKELSLMLKNYIENGFKAQFPFISESTQNAVKFSSISENINSPLMWGHYANNSSGFALAYDFRNNYYNECSHCNRLNISCKTPKSNALLPIVYKDSVLDTTDFARYLMQKTLTQLLFSRAQLSEQELSKILSTVTCSDVYMQTKAIIHKYKEWEYEHEWRMTISYDSPSYAQDQTAYITKKPCALYLGRKIKDTDELILRNIAYKQKIPVYKMMINSENRTYKLNAVRQKNSTKQLLLQ